MAHCRYSSKNFKVVLVVCASLATIGLVCTRTLALQGLFNTLLLFGVMVLGFVVIAFRFFSILKLEKPSILKSDTNQNL